MQQVLYVARHRGLVLPRGTTGHQLAAACRLITDKALLKVCCVSAVEQLLRTKRHADGGC
jgi:hypothetical protein